MSFQCSCGPSLIPLSQTYQTHPVASAAALAVQRYIEKRNLLANCRLRGQQLLSELQTGLAGCQFIWDIRGYGLVSCVSLHGVCLARLHRQFLAVEFKYELFTMTHPRFAARVQAAARSRGLIMTGSSGVADGIRGECVYLAPVSIGLWQETDTEGLYDHRARSFAHSVTGGSCDQGRLGPMECEHFTDSVMNSNVDLSNRL